MTEGSPPILEESNVCVAVKVRPLAQSELDDGCKESILVTPGLSQVSCGQHTFTYDHVFGEGGTPPDQLYSRCIAPLVQGLFKGYNATVFAYGQTGSGKTFTMGSEYKPGGRCRGVIPDAINDIFTRIEQTKDCDVTVRVSFVEIHKEEVKDLLLAPSSGPRPAVTIRETPSGDVTLYGAVEKEVRTREEMAEVLEMGALCRSTASTQMNNRSSRSHAIFTITVEQRRQVQLASAGIQGGEGAGADEDGEDDDEHGGEEAEGVEDFLGAKMHLVDLAGSERAKRTKAEGARLREGIHINRGLLALGNVINAIVDNHKHVPYRDSKLTRLLQDSLGGNSRTVMIACVSPADSNHEESLNTLRYADRARHIRNKPVVNRDPVAAQLAALRNNIAQLKSENLALKRALAETGREGDFGGGGGLDNSAFEGIVERLTHENTSLEAENIRLRMDLDNLARESAAWKEKYILAQSQYDLLRCNQAAAAGLCEGGQNGTASESTGGSAAPSGGFDIIRGYVAKIADLEAELKSVKSLAAHMPFMKRRMQTAEPRTPGGASLTDAASPEPSKLMGDVGSGDEGDGDDDTAEEQQQDLAADEFYVELAARQFDHDLIKNQMVELQQKLEAKEQKMSKLMKDANSMPALKQHYDRALADLQSQRDKLMTERKALTEKLAAVSAANEEERKRLQAMYQEKIHQYDERLRELRRKAKEYDAISKLKQSTEEAYRKLSADITRIKQAKVQLQRQLDASAKQFATWRQERERENAQLRKQGRKDRATIQQLQAMQAKQNAVLQRKISDANAARKRLKEYQEANSRRQVALSTAASQQQAAAATAAQQALGGNVEIQPNAQAPLLRNDKERKDWLEKEIDLCNMSYEFRKVVEGEFAQRAQAARELKELVSHISLLEQLQPTSPMFNTSAGGSMVPISPAVAAAASALGTIGPDSRAKLVDKRTELEEKVKHHQAQIDEVQKAWERQKAEEEQRGGGVMDVRRWAGLRNVAECRELLRMLFKLSAENKANAIEYFGDIQRLQEDIDVLRVQLEGAQKQCGQYRKLAMVFKAAAARVDSTPRRLGPDETDKEVDDVLEMLQRRRDCNPTPPTADGMVPTVMDFISTGGTEDPRTDARGTPSGGLGPNMAIGGFPDGLTAGGTRGCTDPLQASGFSNSLASGGTRSGANALQTGDFSSGLAGGRTLGGAAHLHSGAPDSTGTGTAADVVSSRTAIAELPAQDATGDSSVTLSGTARATPYAADGDVEMMDAETPGKADGFDVEPKALQFLSPVPSGAQQRIRLSDLSAQRYPPEHEDHSGDEAEGAGRRDPGSVRESPLGYGGEDTAMDIDDSEISDEEEEETEGTETEGEESDGDASTESAEYGEDDDEEKDRDWRPECATPFIAGRRNSRRMSSLAAIPDTVGPGTSRQPVHVAEATAIMEEDSDDESCVESPYELATKRRTKGSGRRRTMAFSIGGDVVAKGDEADILNHINFQRDQAGKEKAKSLTVPILKEGLKGKIIDGQLWHLGSKKRADLIQDYRRYFASVGAHDAGRTSALHQARGDVAGGSGIGAASAKATSIDLTESPLPGPSGAEGFTFAPHVPPGAAANNASTGIAPVVRTAGPSANPGLTPSGSQRRLNASNHLEPWARSFINAGNSSRGINWESSLRSSTTIPLNDPALADNPPAGNRHLLRSDSNASNGSLSCGSAGAAATTAPNSGGASSRRPLGWGSPSNGQGAAAGGALRESVSGRLVSPRQIASPRVPVQQPQTATGATSPRTSLGSPTLCVPPRCTGKSLGGSAQSPAGSTGSRDRSYVGGENMQPGCSTPSAAIAGASGAGKSTPLAMSIQEKALKLSERNKELRASLHRTWEQHDPQHQTRAGAGVASLRASLSSLNVGGEGPSRVGGGLRDSCGLGLPGNKQQKGIWR